MHVFNSLVFKVINIEWQYGKCITHCMIPKCIHALKTIVFFKIHTTFKIFYNSIVLKLNNTINIQQHCDTTGNCFIKNIYLFKSDLNTHLKKVEYFHT